jgi:hypothetical protein
MEGWLHKQGHKVKSWKKRWCVLDRRQGFVLSYYEKEDKKTLKGTYILSATSHVTTKPDDGSHKFLFVLHAAGSNGHGDLVMSASGPEELMGWTAAINTLVEACVGPTPAPPPPAPLFPFPPDVPCSPAPPAEDAGTPFPKLGINLKGFREFISLCGGEEELRGLTTSEVSDKYLKDVTRASQLSYCAKLLAEGNDTVGTATHFIR